MWGPHCGRWSGPELVWVGVVGFGFGLGHGQGLGHGLGLGLGLGLGGPGALAQGFESWAMGEYWKLLHDFDHFVPSLAGDCGALHC